MVKKKKKERKKKKRKTTVLAKTINWPPRQTFLGVRHAPAWEAIGQRTSIFFIVVTLIFFPFYFRTFRMSLG